MPAEVHHSPPLHRPGDVTARPKGILKNPSFSSQGSQGPEGHHSPGKDDIPSLPPSAALDPQDSKEITLQNTLQNAGHRRSSSAARRSSASRRQSSIAAGNINNHEDDPERLRLKWDEANLYLAEQESGGRMKITEPKTPFQYGDNAMDEDDEEDVSIDPRFVNVDEVELANMKKPKKPRESEIPGLELGEPEDEQAGADLENERIVRSGTMSRESSKEKHVSVGGDSDGPRGQVGMPTEEDEEKHKQFEERRKKHYEMRNVKDMLGHPESMDDDDDEDIAPDQHVPMRGINGGP